MIKICGSSIYKPLLFISPSCIENGKFTSEWRKGHVVSFHKKGNKEVLENCRILSLLPICGKDFDFGCLIYNCSFVSFIENKLNFSNQSGFKPGYSCINPLLSITHDIYKSFNDRYEFRSVCLDI